VKSSLLLGIIFLLSACASLSSFSDKAKAKPSFSSIKDYSLNLNSKTDVELAIKNGLTRTQVLVRGGLKYLQDEDYEKAKDVFNTALTFDIDNGLLHFLNGYAYHQLYFRGDKNYLNLAEIGYKTAADKEPSLIGISYSLLGSLYLDSKKYSAAQEYIGRAISEGQSSSEILYDFAKVSAINGNFVKSRLAIKELEKRNWSNPLLIKVKAIQAASMANTTEATMLSMQYAKATSDLEDINYVNYRINQVSDQIKNGSLVALSSAPLAALTIPETATESGIVAEAEQNTDTDPTNTLPSPTQNANSTVEAEAKKKTITKWFRCDTETKIFNDIQQVQQSGTDENTLAPTLPQSCPGESPKSAIIEVTMVQNYNVNSSISGVNLLDGLNAILTMSNSRTINSTRTYGAVPSSTRTSSSSDVRSSVLSRGLNDSSLTYSINIANSGLNQSRSLARPTMTVIDRVPSVFFAGSTISLGIAPNNINVVPTIIDKTIGISLAVTPTFVDDESVLVSIRATEAGVSDDIINVPEALLQQTRNSMHASALMKFDETLVINGLQLNTEKRASSGVPIVQDIPFLQYFFKRATSSSSTLNFITFMTLRRSSEDTLLEGEITFEKSLIALKKYVKFDEKDFGQIQITSAEKIELIVNQLKNLIYF
jgi:tetratricopeptide (TPR) repeat protein